MADKDIIAALMGGMGGGGGSDLGALRSTIAQNDLWTQAAQPILGARFDNSTWSPGTTLGVSAGQAFLGALLGGMGQRSQAQQLEKVAQVLPALYENPGAVVAPEGVDREAFGILKLGEMAKNQARTIAQQQDLLKRSLDIEDAGLKKKAETKGELQGKQESYKQSGTADPENPIEKKVAELRTRFEARPEVTNYAYVNRLSNQLLETLKNPSAVSDPILAKMVVQFVEPGLAVNAGEAAGLAASTSIPEAWKGEIAQALSGKSKFLDPKIRQGLLDIAGSAYKAHTGLYAKTYDQYANEAKMFGIDPSRIAALGAPISFQEAIAGAMPSPTPTGSPKPSTIPGLGSTFNGEKVIGVKKIK